MAAGVAATARLTLCRGAEPELPALFADLRASGATKVKVAVAKQAGRAATAVRAPCHGLPDRLATENLVTLGERHGLVVQLSADDFDVMAGDANDPKLRDAARRNCGAGLESCHVTASGQLLGCVAMPGVALGQLHNEGFRAAWEGVVARRYRQQAAGATIRRLCDSGLLLRADVDSGLPAGKRSLPIEAVAAPGTGR